ncbi:DNA glycosylase [Podospora australis]|uniref:Adenine DNA glycosylase n=1 Tax=Podospora australis TaxID=1536484 RepID=A0AAN6WIF2_9PEZI|nr:DNA glycosylase [Podospora australis]
MSKRQSARLASRPKQKVEETELSDVPSDSDLSALPDALSIESDDLGEDEHSPDRPAKRRKPNGKPDKILNDKGLTTTKTPKPKNTKASTDALIQSIFPPTNTSTTALPPFNPQINRTHPLPYHTPLLLTSTETQQSLLNWFDKVHTTRSMPWRQPFTASPAEISKRAYQVWISEVMLQQTRVATVIAYWNKWMARWPTISDLADASEDEVLKMWAGLGYYSRAKRIHQAAQLVCTNFNGLLPDSVEILEKQVPGVGRYTAGALVSIVYGKPAAMVDGNVLRVLSRQMGILGDVKGDKRVIDILWAAAEKLVVAVAGWDGDKIPNDKPGRWGQALMELGSTVCTSPGKPSCGSCPVTGTCRAYQEGLVTARGGETLVGDIEDFCTLCDPFDGSSTQEGDATAEKNGRGKKDGTISAFFESFKATTKAVSATNGTDSKASPKELEIITTHAAKFPLKKAKKQIPEQDITVCAIRRVSDGKYLIHKRPEKGLLGGMWELPSLILPGDETSTTKTRRLQAMEYVSELIPSVGPLNHVKDLGTVPWVFSHLKVRMHVHLFELRNDAFGTDEVEEVDGGVQRWETADEIDTESMGTGMKKCWVLVKEFGLKKK